MRLDVPAARITAAVVDESVIRFSVAPCQCVRDLSRDVIIRVMLPIQDNTEKAESRRPPASSYINSKDQGTMLNSLPVNSDTPLALDAETRTKYERLQTILSEMESVLIAYSGGVDSTLLLKVAHDVLGDRALGALATSPAYAPEETSEALTVAQQLGIAVITLVTHEVEDERYTANTFNR